MKNDIESYYKTHVTNTVLSTKVLSLVDNVIKECQKIVDAPIK